MKYVLVLGLNLLLISCFSTTQKDEGDDSISATTKISSTRKTDTSKGIIDRSLTEGAATCIGVGCPSKPRTLSAMSKILGRSGNQAAIAAQKYLVSLYQSCDVLLEKRKRGGYNQRELEHTAPSCIKPKTFPHYYIDRQGRGRGKPRLSKDYTLTTTLNRMDCSGFISGVLKAAGFKIYPTDSESIDDTSNPELGTDGIRRLDNKSCFQTANFNEDGSLQSGDIINWRIGNSRHAVMITHLSNDPFAIKKLSKDQCTADHINADDFDFDIAHSLGWPNTGPVQHNIQAFFDGTGNMIKSRFILMAIQACNAHHNKQATSAVLGRGSFKIIRHKGESDANCIADNKPAIEGENCYNQCVKEE
jgi:hypothetical protein